LFTASAGERLTITPPGELVLSAAQRLVVEMSLYLEPDRPTPWRRFGAGPETAVLFERSSTSVVDSACNDDVGVRFGGSEHHRLEWTVYALSLPTSSEGRHARGSRLRSGSIVESSFGRSRLSSGPVTTRRQRAAVMQQRLSTRGTLRRV
jgi:hypothetical protein